MTPRGPIAVFGATGAAGRTVVADLRAAGYEIRRIATSLGVSMTDREALGRALAGVDAAYVMVPFDRTAPDLHASERAMIETTSQAIAASEVTRVVHMSGLNAHLRRGTSLGAAMMEDALADLHLPELTVLRCAFFMENFLTGMEFAPQARTGVFATPFRGDRPMHLVAAADVGHRAADLLLSDELRAGITELHGPDALTLVETTAVLSAAMALDDVTYCQQPYAEARSSMISAGMPDTFADALIETATSFNDELPWALADDSADTASPTHLTTWAATALATEGRP